MNRCAVFRSVRLQLRRLATALAVVAAFALVLDGALGADHHLPAAASSGHYHAHGHSHASAGANHHALSADTAGSVDLAAGQQDSAPQPGLDANANCCFCCCSAAVVLPSLTAQGATFALMRTSIAANPRASDGVEPEGLRRPPRPLSIA
jgi:hypothetical protein